MGLGLGVRVRVRIAVRARAGSGYLPPSGCSMVNLKSSLPGLVRARARVRVRVRGRVRVRVGVRGRVRVRARVRVRILVARPVLLVANDVDDLNKAVVEVLGLRVAQVAAPIVLRAAPLEPRQVVAPQARVGSAVGRKVGAVEPRQVGRVELVEVLGD